MQIHSVGAFSAYQALQHLSNFAHKSGEEEQENATSATATRSDQATLSAWSITLSRQTSALIQTNAALSDTAAEAKEELSPREQVDEMTELVRQMNDEGKISWRRARHLLKTLDLAAKALEHGRALPAARLLRHVARVADKLAGFEKMPGEEATKLIESARSTVDQLREDASWPIRHDANNRAGILLMKSEFRLTITQATVTHESAEVETVD
jgi:hypothetical protein